MSYSNQFVSAIKVHGKILRENNSTVALPFGAEYTILLKNLKSVRALVEVTIDGESATGGEKLILQPNSELDFERTIRNRNFDAGNKFKFIERTETIEKNRVIGASDGLIRIEFWTEKIKPIPQWNSDIWSTKNTDYPNYPHWGRYTMCRSVIPQADYVYAKCADEQSTTLSTQNFSSSASTITAQGITVPGSKSDQKFVEGAWFETEQESVVFVFQLVGKISNQEVVNPITVDVKPTCITCGKLNRATNKFCSECGTSLILF